MSYTRHSPHEDSAREPGEDSPALWPAPTATRPLSFAAQIPGSKSLTNRELVLSALAQEPSRIRRPLFSRDTSLMIDALAALGTRIEQVDGDGAFGRDLLITPGELHGGTVDCGLAGTVMRFVPPLAALGIGPASFDGDPGARVRPMRTVIEALRALGVDVADDGRGALPFTVHGTGAVDGGTLRIDASASSQFVSGLMLSAPRFGRGLDLVHEGPSLPSLPHIDMTIHTLTARGGVVTQIGDARWRIDPTPIRGAEVTIEPDLSNATPFLAAAAVVGGSVTIAGWPATTTQVGDMFPSIVERMGARVDVEGDALTVSGTGRLDGIDIDLTPCGELTPTVAGLAALATGPSVLRGIAHLRGHETDRLAALATEITALGGAVTETADGLVIDPRPLSGGTWHSYADHRMATTGALIGLVTPDVLVEGIEATSKTLPEFVSLWRAMLGRTAASTISIEVPLG